MTEKYFDIHSHILPEVDDGSVSLAMTTEMIDTAYRQGVRTMIATPHYYPGHRNVSGEDLEQIYRETASVIKEKYSDFTLLLGNEIYYKDEIVKRLQNREIFTLAGTRYILIEFPVTAQYKYIYDAVQKCVNAGYYPVLAHMERYGCLRKSMAFEEGKVKELIRAGAYMQMNAENFRSGIIVPGRKECMKLLGKNLIHFLGSDCHNMAGRKPDLGNALEYLSQKADRAVMKRLIRENPEKLLENKCI